MGWTVFHLDDLDADFLRYYRAEWWDMDGPEFFRRATRVTAYGGVMAMRLREQQAETEADPDPDDLAGLDDLASDPAFAGLIESR